MWCPKDRHGVSGRIAGRCGRLLEQIAAGGGWQMVAREVMPDHVDLFVRVGSPDAPAEVVRVVTGRTARGFRQEFAHLRGFAKVLWSPSYIATSVGDVSESTMRRDIEHRWDGLAS